MAPLIVHGDQVSITPSATQDILIGDIVAFKRADSLICHRIVGRWQWGPWLIFFEKGDRVRFGRFLKPTAVIGKVLSVNQQPIKNNYLPLKAGRLAFLVLASLCSIAVQTIKEYFQQHFHISRSIQPHNL